MKTYIVLTGTIFSDRLYWNKERKTFLKNKFISTAYNQDQEEELKKDYRELLKHFSEQILKLSNEREA